MLYRDCQGCYKRVHYSKIIYVKEYMDGANLMSPQWLCQICYSMWLESYIECKKLDRLMKMTKEDLK